MKLVCALALLGIATVAGAQTAPWEYDALLAMILASIGD